MKQINLLVELDKAPIQSWEKLYNSFAVEYKTCRDKVSYFNAIQSISLNSETRLSDLESLFEDDKNHLFNLFDKVHLLCTNNQNGYSLNKPKAECLTLIKKLKVSLGDLFFDFQSDSFPLPLSDFETDDYYQDFKFILDNLKNTNSILNRFFEIHSFPNNYDQNIIISSLRTLIHRSYGIKKIELLESVSSQIFSIILKDGFIPEIKPYDELTEEEKEEIEATKSVGRPFSKEVDQSDIEEYAKIKLYDSKLEFPEKTNKKFWHQNGLYEGQPIWNSLAESFLEDNKGLDFTPRRLIDRFKIAYETIINS